MTKVGVVGLGNMGHGMARTLTRQGVDVAGFDTSDKARAQAQQAGLTVRDSLQALAKDRDVIILSLPAAKHVQAVCTHADGLLDHARPSTVIIDTTTSTPQTSRDVSKALAKRDIRFIDAPVSGGPAGASSGTMTMVIGGDLETVSRVMPILKAVSAKRVHIGDTGAGNVAKIINNLLCASHLITAAQAMLIGRQAGVDPQRLLDGINGGSGRSAVTEINFPKWVMNGAFDSGFTMGLMRKDIGLANDLLQELELTLPMVELVNQTWSDSVTKLADSEDFNRLVQLIDPNLGRKSLT